MENWNYLLGLLRDPKFTNYIIAAQIPTVLCLSLTSVIIYKLGFKSFKNISLGWAINFLYLIISIITRNENNLIKDILITSFDLTSMYFFYIAIEEDLIKKHNILLKDTKIVFIILAVVIGLIRIIPSIIQSTEGTYLYYAPHAFFDFSILALLVYYFTSQEKKYLKKRDHFLSAATFIYACLQILSIFQDEQFFFQNHWYNVSSIGFSLGLTFKILILLLLSRYAVYAVKVTTGQQKENLVEKFSKATIRILTIKFPNRISNIIESENFIIQNTLFQIEKLLTKHFAYYSSYDEKAKKLEILFTTDDYNIMKRHVYSADVGLTGDAIRSKEMRIMHSLKESSSYKKFKDSTNIDYGVQSALAYPLIIDDRCVGVFMIESKLEDDFSTLDISIVKSLTYQAAVAIKNNQLVSEIEISKLFLNSLKKIDKEITINAERNSAPVLEFVLEIAQKMISYEQANIDIVKDGFLICVASTNRKIIGRESKIHECLSGRAVIDKEIKYYSDLSKLPTELENIYKDYFGANQKCQLTVPLIVNNEVIGIFNTESSVVDKFNEDDINTIDSFAGQTAILLYITKLIEDIDKKNIALENSLDIRNIEMTSLLSSLINHKIGNEIGAIRTIIKDELLRGDFGEISAEIKARLELIQESAIHVLETQDFVNEAIEELMKRDLSPIDFGDIKSKIENLDLFKINKALKVTFSNFELLKPVYISSYVLIEVLSELLNNSAKSMNYSGNIDISGNVEMGYSIIEIRDHGCGIPKSNFEIIFDKNFSQWPKHITSGGGIGLSAVRRIVGKWDGEIAIKSEVGKGTSFFIKLPIQKIKIEK